MQPQVHYLKNYLPPQFLINNVELEVDLYEENTQVVAKIALQHNPDSTEKNNNLILSGEGLVLKSLTLNNKKLTQSDYKVDEHSLTIYNCPAEANLEIVTEIQPQLNTALSGLYKSSGIFCTQCEAEGFRHITYFLDRPDVLATYVVTIKADKKRYPKLLANGNLIEQGDLENGRHFAKWQDPFKKPCYLFAMVAGDLAVIEDKFVTRSGRTVQLKVFTEHGQEERCKHALKSLQKAMRWDEEVYQREYDLDIYMIVSVADFNMGAMENKGLNVFNNQYVLADNKTATDHDYHAVEAVIAHEYFHNWTGNRITCRDWFQLSLKEGLTIFREQQFCGDVWSKALVRINETRLLRMRQFQEDAGPMAHPVRPDSYIEINNFYTVTVYHKGSEVIRMLKTLIGDKAFAEGMQLYFKRHDGQAVTIDDFVQAMADVSQQDLTQFKRWYSQAGTPEVTVNSFYDADNETYSLTFTQTCPATPDQPEKLPFTIPIAMGLLDKEGKEIPLQLADEKAPGAKSRVLVVTQPQQRFDFVGIKHTPIPSLLRDFSAPVKLTLVDDCDERLEFVLKHDTDFFARWDAGQQLALNTMKHLIVDAENETPLELKPSFVNVYRSLLQDTKLDKALLTELLSLPDEAYLAESFPVVDMLPVCKVHDFVIQQLSHQLKNEFLEVYQRNQDKKYEYSQEAMTKRMLKNMCLSFLLHTKDAQMYDLAWQQYQAADNMTDAIAALRVLTHHESTLREAALSDFYDNWHKDPVVINKWFAVQATARLPDALARVKALMKHPAFELKNPNKARSLIGTFSRFNYPAFHTISGEGYAFLTDCVIELNTVNPQLASSLLEPLIHWRKYEINHSQLMKVQLERIAGVPKLAKNVYELVSKALSNS